MMEAQPWLGFHCYGKTIAMFKRIRIAILLFILVSVAVGSWHSHQRVHAWTSTVYVVVYPINGDGSAVAANYIASLDESKLAAMQDFLEAQAHRYGIPQSRPVQVSLGPKIDHVPPAQPVTHNTLDAIRWSLSMRYWAWLRTPKTDVRPEVRMYALYYDPATTHTAPDSTGLAKAQIGLANLFASPSMHGSNLVVLTHEFLHTLGATDRYDLSTGLPLFPEGYADPNRNPLYPQSQAEIMAGRIPVSETQAETPFSLKDTLIGKVTAQEIGWLKQPGS